ncbi:MAG TPA: hypothetical protein P5298_05820 [Spirochaetia bacterium]|nr:hypothetical protein [Spirochaetia bacterium]
MTTRRRGAIAAAAALAIALAAASPPPLAADDEGVRVMARCSGDGAAADPASLAAALAKSPLLDAVLAAPDGLGLVEAASRASCALAVEADSRSAGGEAASAWRVLDPLTGATLASGVVEGPEPGPRDLAEFWWLPVVEAAEAALPTVARTLVRVTAAPGTVVSGLSDEPMTVPESGELELPLRVPGTYPWRAVSSGAYPESGYFGALEQGVSLAVPRTPLRRWAIEAGLYMTQFPDLWASWRFMDDRLFLRAGLRQFLAGLYLVGEEYGEDTPPAILSLPLIQPGIGIGGYFLPPDAFVRPYAQAGAGLRLLVASWAPLVPEPVAPLALEGAFGAEWGLTRRIAVFVELGASYYPFCDGFLMASVRGADDSGPSGFLYGGSWLVELPTLRFGARLSL